jgi:NAD(P)-dependent dehydrogenase (short-subunit alcohol dehydrogenase family)
MPETQEAPRVWLITGCSSGIGRAIAVAALEAGDHVAVTARDPSSVASLVAAHPGRALSLPLDVTDAGQVTSAVAAVEARFGRLDVLVNNAGYGYVSAVEEGVDADVRRMFDTNFFGPIALIKAVLPGMRARRSGYIVNISSMTGLVSNPGAVYYSSSKFALESLTEGLSKEVGPLGIRVTAVEPGFFRTDWSGRSMEQSEATLPDYAPTVGVRREQLAKAPGEAPGDPARVGDAVVMLSRLDAPPLHLLLGRDVYDALTAKLEGWKQSIEAWKDVTLDVGFREDGPPRSGGEGGDEG